MTEPIPAVHQLRMRPPDALLEDIRDRPEDQWFDRKSSRIQAVDLAKTLVAFANAEGGMIAIGVYGNKFEGITAKQENEWRQAARNFTSPAFATISRG